MEKFRKVWDAEKNGWLMETKGMTRSDAYKAFLERFPECTDVTEVAFYNQRSRVGASVKRTCRKYSRAPRPLWSEQVKKGYVRIKVAQPNVWMPKSKWVYMETHPWEDFSERSNFIFLDGDNRNFDPNNIERIPLKLMGVFCQLGGCVEGHPELTRLNVLRARLRQAQLDRLEDLGETARYNGNERVEKGKRARYAREYYWRNHEKVLEYHRKNWAKKHDEYLAKQRKYREENREHINALSREYARKRRAK